MTAPAVRVVEHLALQYRRAWRGSVVTSFLNPLLFLAAMGVGLGSLVDRGAGEATLAGTAYLDFVAPGLLAAAPMQTAAGETTWPVLGAFKWVGTYHAMIATPIRPLDVVAGQLLWITARLAMTAGAFFAVMAAFGAVRSPWGVLAIAAATLTGLAFAAPILGFAATRETDGGFNALFRFGITPLFLFSGTFFPVRQLPDAIEPVAYVTPLWHGVSLCRELVLGEATLGSAAGHAAVLAVFTAAGAAWAAWGFRRRLWL